MSPRNPHLRSDTYLHNPRYLELHGKCRLVRLFPDSDPNHFAKGYDEIVGHGFLTAREYQEMEKIASDWWAKEIDRLEAAGFHAQADALRQEG